MSALVLDGGALIAIGRGDRAVMTRIEDGAPLVSVPGARARAG